MQITQFDIICLNINDVGEFCISTQDCSRIYQFRMQTNLLSDGASLFVQGHNSYLSNTGLETTAVPRIHTAAHDYLQPTRITATGRMLLLAYLQ